MRASAAGFVDEERAELANAYARAQARTWERMKSACEADAALRKTLEEISSSDDDENRDWSLVNECASSLELDATATRDAVRRVAEWRAAGASSGRAKTREERIFFALTESSEDLFRELARTFGEDKAVRAVDYGAVCLADTIYRPNEESE